MLISSEKDLSPWLILQLLNEVKREDVEKHLVDEFSKINNNLFDYFLPQICILLLSRVEKVCALVNLEKFFLEKCMKSIHFALKSFWYLDASSNYSKDKKVIENCTFLRDQLHNVVVNGELPKRLQNTVNEKQRKTVDAKKIMFKKKIADYFEHELELMNWFENLSSKLAQYKKQHREELLKKNLHHLQSNLYKGLYFPLQKTADSKHVSVHACLVDEGRIMNSAQKVPFYMVWEVVDSEMNCSSTDIPKLLERPTCASVEKFDFQNEKENLVSEEKKTDKNNLDLRSELTKLATKEKATKEVSKKEVIKHKKINKKNMTEKNTFKPLQYSSIDKKNKWKLTSKTAKKYKNRWDTQSIIFKSGEDLRQEAFAIQMILLFESIFKEAELPIQLHPFSIVPTSGNSGLIECISDATALTSIRTEYHDLYIFWNSFFGVEGTPEYDKATKNFVESLAGYSIICYILQLKDRHNGNIMILRDGCIAHIDFGFMFTSSPGGNFGFESSPFKLPYDWIQIMGGDNGKSSEPFEYFKKLLIQSYIEIRKHFTKFKTLVEIMLKGPALPCFIGGRKRVLKELEARFCINKNDEEIVKHVSNIIEQSACNWRSYQYDNLQLITNGIQ